MKKEIKYKAIKTSFIIAFLYVGFGTLSVLSLDPDFVFFGDWAWLGFLVSLPVSVFGFGIVYAEPDYMYLLIVTQVVVLLVFWFIVFKVLLKRYIRKNRKVINND